MGYLSVRASKTFLEGFRANYSHEQLELAAKAHREGDRYAEFVYRNNAVDILPMGKLNVIEQMKSTWTFGFPFAAPILDRIGAFPDLEKAQRITYCMELGRLAEATENIGLKEDADKLWLRQRSLREIMTSTGFAVLLPGFIKSSTMQDQKNSKNNKAAVTKRSTRLAISGAGFWFLLVAQAGYAFRSFLCRTVNYWHNSFFTLRRCY
jgi:hypothetical protein